MSLFWFLVIIGVSVKAQNAEMIITPAIVTASSTNSLPT